MNLDGSASWQGRSADEILDEFLAPFQDGPPAQGHRASARHQRRPSAGVDRGRRGSARNGETPLTAALYQLLQQEAASQESHIRFISLNQRSLVGGITPEREQIETAFLERLMDHLYGGEEAAEIWSPCQSCSAKDRCEVFRAARLFGPDTLPALDEREVRLACPSAAVRGAAGRPPARRDAHHGARIAGGPGVHPLWCSLLRRLSRRIGDRRASLLGPRVLGGFAGTAGRSARRTRSL